MLQSSQIKRKSQQLFRKNTQRKRARRKPYLIYPNNKRKLLWDFWISIILLYSCMEIPYNEVFHDDFKEDSLLVMILGGLVDLFFLIDIIVNFFSAYRDE